MRELRVWWQLTFAHSPLHKDCVKQFSLEIISCSNCLTIKRWQETFFSTYLFRTTYFLSLTWKHINCALEGSLLQISEGDLLPENKVLPLCRRKHSCLHFISAIAAYFFSWHAASFTVWGMPLSGPFVILPKGRSIPLSHFLFLPCCIWFLRNFKTVRWTIIILLKYFAEWKYLLFWSQHLSIWYCPLSCCYNSDLYFGLLFKSTLWYCLVLLTFWRISLKQKYEGWNFWAKFLDPGFELRRIGNIDSIGNSWPIENETEQWVIILQQKPIQEPSMMLHIA